MRTEHYLPMFQRKELKEAQNEGGIEKTHCYTPTGESLKIELLITGIEDLDPVPMLRLKGTNILGEVLVPAADLMFSSTYNPKPELFNEMQINGDEYGA